MAATATKTTTGRGPWAWPKYSRGPTKQTISALLWTLHDMGGTIEDVSGQAASKLVGMAEQRGTPVSPGSHVGQLMPGLAGGIYGRCVEREIGTKRTYKITLLLGPDEMPPRPRKLNGAKALTQQSVQAAPDPEPAPEPEPVDPPAPTPEPQPEPVRVTLVAAPEMPETEPIPSLQPEHDDSLGLALALADGVARLIEVMVVEGAQASVPNPDAEDQAVRLGQMMEEVRRLRQQKSQLADLVQSQKKEIDGVRKAWQLAEANLRTLRETVANGSRRADVGKFDRNQRFISEKPEPAIMRRAR